MPVNLTHHDYFELDAARLAGLQQQALENASAAQEWLGRLAAYATGLRIRVERGDLDAVTLKAVADQARDLRQCAEALAVGLT